MIKGFRKNGKFYSLIFKDNMQSELNFISWTQSKTGIFLNVEIKPYKGKRWNKEKVCWIIEG